MRSISYSIHNTYPKASTEGAFADGNLLGVHYVEQRTEIGVPDPFEVLFDQRETTGDPLRSRRTHLRAILNRGSDMRCNWREFSPLSRLVGTLNVLSDIHFPADSPRRVIIKVSFPLLTQQLDMMRETDSQNRLIIRC